MSKAFVGADWLQARWVAPICALIAAIPLLAPAIPPLTDVPGHIGIYRILSDALFGEGGAVLGHHYAVQAALLPNLGVELLVLTLHPLLDVEPATHLVVALIPVLTVAAMLWLARVVHGRIPPAAGFALPLAYALPFQLGFVNFALSAALALAALALWIRLAGWGWRRSMLFVPIAGTIWLCHSFGWAMLGLFAFGADFALRRERGEPLLRAAAFAGLGCLPMAWPQLLATVCGVHPTGDTGDWFDWTSKAQSVAQLLRERWKAYDVACAALLVLIVWAGVRSRRLSFAPVLGVPALLGFVAFVLTPRLLAGGAYVDMRLLPATLGLALLAIRVEPGAASLAARLAAGGMAFFGLRLGSSTVALALFAAGQQAELRTVDRLPVGGRVLTLVAEPSPAWWDNPRLGHIAGIAIARRRVFTNEPWAISGQQPIVPLHPAAAPFDRDPSQLVYPAGASYATTDFDRAIASFDRTSFDHVWTIGFPPGRAHAGDLALVWHDDRSALYRVRSDSARLSTPPLRL